MKQEEIITIFSGIGIGICFMYITLSSIKKCYKKKVSFSQVKNIKYIPTKEELYEPPLPDICIYCNGDNHLVG